MIPARPELNTPLTEARIPSYEALLAQMLANARGQTVPDDGQGDDDKPLSNLCLENQTFAVATMRAWAIAGDILAFYQARFAEQGYLSTADQASQWELLKLIGQGPSAQASDSATVSFAVSQNTGINIQPSVPSGTAIRSVNQQGAVAQIYETSSDIPVHGEWNEVPILVATAPSPIEYLDPVTEFISNTWSASLAGTGLGLKPGDRLLLMPSGELPAVFPATWVPAVASATEYAAGNVTNVVWVYDDPPEEGPPKNPTIYVLNKPETLYGANAPQWGSLPELIQVQQGGRRGGGIFRRESADGEWDSFNAGLPPVSKGKMPATAIAFAPNGDAVAASPFGVSVTMAKSDVWTVYTSGLTSLEVTAVTVDQGAFYAGTSVGTVFRSLDEGAHWDLLDGLVKVSSSPTTTNPQQQPTPGSSTTWTPVSTKLPRAVVRLLEVSGAKVIAATDAGVFSWASDSSGWIADAYPSLKTSPAINAWLPNADGTIFAAYVDGFLLRSATGTWSSKSALPQNAAPLGLVRLGENSFACSTATGVFLSEDQGATWTDISEGLPTGSEPVIVVDSTGALLASASDGALYRWNVANKAWDLDGPLPTIGVTTLAAGPDGSLIALSPSEGIIDSDWPTSGAVPGHIDLSRVVPSIVPGSIVVMEDESALAETEVSVFTIGTNTTVRRTDMMQSAEVSRLSIPSATLESLQRFSYRTAAVMAAIRALPVAQRIFPYATPADCQTLTVTRRIADLPGGRQVLVTGKAPRVSAPSELSSARETAGGMLSLISDQTTPIDEDGSNALPALPEDPVLVEHAIVKSFDPAPPNAVTPSTTIEFLKALNHRFDPTTVTIHFNVIEVTHGKTQASEVLGSGDSSQEFQAFPLKQPHLAYVAKGKYNIPVSTLKVFVDGVQWTEVPSFANSNPSTRCYMVRLDPGQQATVIFGDGKHGARLPTGTNNVVATYRTADPSQGQADASNIAFWDSRPMGVERVHNPGKTKSYPPAPTSAQASVLARFKMQTFGRAVNVDDVAAIAQIQPGVAAATARRAADTHGEHVRLAVALTETSASPEEIQSSLDALFLTCKGFAMPVRAVICDVVPFYFVAQLLVANDHFNQMQQSLSTSLGATFGFPNWPPERGLRTYEMLSALQRLPGVLGVELKGLALTPNPTTVADLSPQASENGSFILAVDPADLTFAPMLLTVPGSTESVLTISISGGDHA